MPIALPVAVACSCSLIPALSGLVTVCLFQSVAPSHASEGPRNLLWLSRIRHVYALLEVPHTFRPPLNSTSVIHSLWPHSKLAYGAHGFAKSGTVVGCTPAVAVRFPRTAGAELSVDFLLELLAIVLLVD